jgi:Mg2+/Co2+ transporter CorB
VDNLPIWVQILILVVLLAVSGFFSISETSMMAINRFRLRHLAKQNNRAAKRTQGLLDQTERLLGVILIGNNVVNTIAAMFSGAIATHYWGENQIALSIAAALISFAIIVFSELTPKVIGAAYPEKIALPASFIFKAFVEVDLSSRLVHQLIRQGFAQADAHQSQTRRRAFEQRRSPCLGLGTNPFDAEKTQEHFGQPI